MLLDESQPTLLLSCCCHYVGFDACTNENDNVPRPISLCSSSSSSPTYLECMQVKFCCFSIFQIGLALPWKVKLKKKRFSLATSTIQFSVCCTSVDRSRFSSSLHTIQLEYSVMAASRHRNQREFEKKCSNRIYTEQRKTCFPLRFHVALLLQLNQFLSNNLFH